MTRSSNRRALLIVGAVLAFLVVATALTYRNTQKLEEDADWVAHTHRVLDLLSSAKADLNRAEAEQRGYLVTGDDAFRQEYEQAKASAGKVLADLISETRDNQVQNPRAVDLKQQADALLAVLDRGIESRPAEESAARASFASHNSTAQMHELRTTTEAFEQEERQLLGQRQQRSLSTYYLALIMGLATSLVGLGLILSVVLLRASHQRAQERATAVIHEQREWLRMAMNSPPEQREAILARIEAIDAEMLPMQRRAVLEGTDLRADWDRLRAERSYLEQKFWEVEKSV